MTTRLFLLLIVTFSGLIGFGQTSRKILFLGNSYTYVNNLPQIAADIALSMNDTIFYDSNTPGGYTLQGHSTNTTSLNKIMAGNWDYVVLQEQSQLPSFNIAQVETDVFPYAQVLDSIINYFNPCAETMFYMTWGRKNGDASNCTAWPPVCTYNGMDSLLNLRYQMMADSNNSEIAAVGAVWKYIRTNYPLIELYQADESHPSAAGSYAAACCFYTSVFRKNPLSINYDFSLTAADAANIRTAVKAVIYDDLMNYNIGKYDPVANFNSTSSIGNVVAFGNISENATSYEWDFGDVNTSVSTDPIHTYTASGNYTVTLIAYYCEKSDTIVQVISTTPTSANQIHATFGINIHPNPFTDFFSVEIKNFKMEALTIFDVTGRSVYSSDKPADCTRIDFSHFSSGIYFIKVTTEKQVFLEKIIKQ